MYEYVAARRLATQLGAELASTRAGAPCVLTVHPGSMTPQYGCGCDGHEGIAWTRVLNSYLVEAGSFPRQMTAPLAGGRLLQLAAVIELGVDRCYWSQDEKTMLPEPITILDSLARDASDDAAAMRRAALGSGFGDLVVGMWVPRPTLGGVHGGTMPVTVLIDQCLPGQPMPPLDEVLPMLDGDPRA